jgi:hypothetical protein
MFGAIQQVPHASDHYVTGSVAEILRPQATPLEPRGESTMELLIALPSIFLFLLAEVLRHRREEEVKAHRRQEQEAWECFRRLLTRPATA